MLTLFLGSATSPPIFLHFRSSKTFIIVTVASSVFTDIFAYGIVVPVFPFALTAKASIDPDDVQRWVSILLAVYGAALLVASPVCGWLADRMESRQLSFLLGLLALGGSTAILCAGESIGMFVAGRVLQGVSAAVVWCVGLALLVDTVGPEDVGIAMGYVGLSMSLAILLAPLLGGVVFAKAGYYSVYAMAFGLIVLDVVLRVLMIEQKTARKWIPEAESHVRREERTHEPITKHGEAGDDVKDMITAVEPQDAEDEITRKTSQTPNTVVEAVLPKTPPTPSRAFVNHLPPVVFLFSSRRVLSAMWACTMQSTLLTSFDSILPLFVKDTFNWDATGAGLIFLPIVLASFLGPLIGKFSDKYGPRWFATAGFVLSCPFLILLRLVDRNTLGQKALLCALLAFIGLGLTLALVPLMAEMSYAVDAKAKRHPPGFFGKNGAYAQAYGLFNMAWAAGSMIGPLLAGFVSESRGWAVATLILGCVGFFTALPTAVWTGGSIFKQRKTRQLESTEV